jgi:carotenoid cleavage dioxygenase-like enzyme
MPTSMLSTGGEDVMATDHVLALNVLSGELPTDIYGHMFVAGSIATPGRPAFSGEGTVYRIDIEQSGVALKQAVFKPPCFLADQALQVADQGGLLGFHDLGLTRLSPLLGVRTVLSNSPIALRDRMIITTDAGRPWEFDPITLELVTPIGKSDEWLGSIPAPWVFPLFLTSAHPGEDRRTGELFTANYANAGAGNPGFTHLIRWHKAGALEHFQIIDERGDPVVINQCVHQIGDHASNHVILQDSAFVVEMRQMLFDAADLLMPGMPIEALFFGGANMSDAPTDDGAPPDPPRKALTRAQRRATSDAPTPVRASASRRAPQ